MDAEDDSSARRYELKDGRVLRVTAEIDRWLAWLEGVPDSQTFGFPLEGVLAEVVGLNPAHDDIPVELLQLAERIRQEFPEHEQPNARYN